MFRREAIPLHATMTENPHYDTNRSPSFGDPKEDCDNNKVSLPLLLLDKKPEYKLISSTCLRSMKELGEGVFGKVHLASYISSEDLGAEKFLVAVSKSTQ